MCAQSVSYLNSKYQSFFSARSVSRYTRTDVTFKRGQSPCPTPTETSLAISRSANYQHGQIQEKLHSHEVSDVPMRQSEPNPHLWGVPWHFTPPICG